MLEKDREFLEIHSKIDSRRESSCRIDATLLKCPFRDRRDQREKRGNCSIFGKESSALRLLLAAAVEVDASVPAPRNLRRHYRYPTRSLASNMTPPRSLPLPSSSSVFGLVHRSLFV